MRRRLLEKREEEGVAQEIARFIDRYHEHLDAERVLELFPDDVSFDQLYPYTAQAITALTESMYNTRMKNNLLMSEFMEVGLEEGSDDRTSTRSRSRDRTAWRWARTQSAPSVRSRWARRPSCGSATRSYITTAVARWRGRCGREMRR